MTSDEVKNRLTESYPDGEIQVIDMTGGGSNFQVAITTSAFEGLNRVKRHQAVMAIFDNELKSGEIHALAIQANTPASE